MSRAARWVWSVVGVVATAGCSASATAEPEVALAVPAPGASRPVDSAELTPGATHRFADVLPDTLDLEVDVAGPGVYPLSGPFFAYLAGDVEMLTDVVTVAAADSAGLYSDPFDRGSYGAEVDPDDYVVVPPGELLTMLAELDHLELTADERPVRIGGADGRAVDVRVRALPAGTEPCRPGDPPCADLFHVPGFGQAVIAGQELRLAQLDLPAGRLLVVQNLQDARARTVVDTMRFVERPPPAELGPVRLLPYTMRPLEPGVTYGARIPDVGVGVSFAVGPEPTVAVAAQCACVIAFSTDVPADLLEIEAYGYRSSTEKVFGLVSPAAEQLIPEPGVDPRVLGPAAFARSTGPGDGGVVELLIDQPWVDVLAGPYDTTVGGLPARAVEVGLRAGAGSVPCTIGRPEDDSCAVLLYTRASPGMLLLAPDRPMRVASTAVGDQDLTVVTSLDAPGHLFAESLRLVDLAP